MCPCPFCASLAILLCPLLLFKRTRKWLQNKICHHHENCDRCQHAEHEQHLHNHTPCHCQKCQVRKSQKHAVRRKGRK